MQTLPNGSPRYFSESSGGNSWHIYDRKEGRWLLRNINNAHDMELVLKALNAL